MPDVRRKSGRRIAKITGRAIPIPIAVATYFLADYVQARFSGPKSLPNWEVLVICAVVCVTCITITLAAIAYKAMNFLLRLMIVISYSGDSKRSNANGFVTMFRELNQRDSPESHD